MSHSLKLRICDIWKCHKMSHFFKSLVQSYVYLLCLDPARNGSHCLSRDAEHIRLAAFVGAVTKSKWGGLVWKLKNRCRQKLSSTLEKCTTIQRTPSWGIMFRDFSIFEGMKKKKKSAQITHLTAEPILKQCVVYGSRPPIASKPGPSSPEQSNITGQAWSEATCPRTSSDSAYFRFVTLF